MPTGMWYVDPTSPQVYVQSSLTGVCVQSRLTGVCVLSRLTGVCVLSSKPQVNPVAHPTNLLNNLTGLVSHFNHRINVSVNLYIGGGMVWQVGGPWC